MTKSLFGRGNIQKRIDDKFLIEHDGMIYGWEWGLVEGNNSYKSSIVEHDRYQGICKPALETIASLKASAINNGKAVFSNDFFELLYGPLFDPLIKTFNQMMVES